MSLFLYMLSLKKLLYFLIRSSRLSVKPYSEYTEYNFAPILSKFGSYSAGIGFEKTSLSPPTKETKPSFVKILMSIAWIGYDYGK